MKITSTNIGQKTKIKWRFKTIETGIFKSATTEPIYLGETDVKNDHVIDRKYHGGIDKACYAFNANAYPFWQSQYPNLKLTPGWFGENLTIEDLNESEIKIGDQYKIGEAIIEVSQPREPCFKLGIRFNTQKVIKQFINSKNPGIYFRVIKPGLVKEGDELVLLKTNDKEPTVLEIYQLIYKQIDDSTINDKAKNSQKLALSAKKSL